MPYLTLIRESGARGRIIYLIESLSNKVKLLKQRKHHLDKLNVSQKEKVSRSFQLQV